jgi:oligopeptide transport system substrate-binding protein
VRAEAVMKRRWLAVAIAIPALVATACGSSSVGKTNKLASHQLLRFPIIADISTLDPGLVTSTQDDQLVQNVFAGLYEFNDQLVEVPVAATAMPDISSDGLTYTFHLKHDVKFSNGDLVTSADVLYSWNRVARLNGEDSFIMRPVVGYATVAPAKGVTPTATTLSGLSAPDPYTIVAKLSSPASYWIDELAIPSADLVDQKVIHGDLDRTWWASPNTAIGTGPFKLTSYVPKNHLSFGNVTNWWGGSTGHLTDVEVDVVASSSSQVTEYLAGGLDEIGPANTQPPLDAVLHFEHTPSLKSQVAIGPGGSTTWIGVNMANGPFAPNPSIGITDPISLAGRLAFSMSIDRTELANIVCGGGLTCTAATGGIVPKGLRGNLGDGGDPSSAFSATKAKQELQIWDPNGTKRQGLTYWYYAQDLTKAVAENLQAQWEKNLGIHVAIQGVDFTAYLNTLEKQATYILFADYTSAFYNNPEDWFARQFVCAQAPPGHDNLDGLCDPRIDAQVTKAEGESDSQSIPSYVQAGQLLAGDGANAVLYYAKNVYFIKSYVLGAGGNALDDFYWSDISILAH